MTLNAQVEAKITVAGMNFAQVSLVEDEGSIASSIKLPAGLAGSLTTRGSATAGTITSADHNILDTDKLAIFWEGDTPGSRYNVTVSSHTSTTILFTGGVGDNLPLQDTAVVVGRQYTISESFVGNKVSVLAVQADQRVSVSFEKADGTVELDKDLAAGGLFSYSVSSDLASPFADPTATVEHIDVANGSTVECNFQMGILYNSSTV